MQSQLGTAVRRAAAVHLPEREADGALFQRVVAVHALRFATAGHTPPDAHGAVSQAQPLFPGAFPRFVRWVCF